MREKRQKKKSTKNRADRGLVVVVVTKACFFLLYVCVVRVVYDCVCACLCAY